MATVYKVEIELVSPWTNFKAEDIQKFVEKSILDAVDNADDKRLGQIENVEVKATRIA